jgi:RNA polymerase sigma factor (sigma-70 family)
MTAVQDWGIVGPDSSDAELAVAAAAGDRRAFAGIYDRYANRLHDFCAGMLADRDAAADCVQDAFCDAATCLRDLRELDKLRAWLYGIARHQCLRRLRERRKVQPSDALPDMASADAGPDALARRTELADLIAEAAGGLSDRDRSVLELSYRHDLDPPELAEALGVSQTNANTMVHRLRETMERSLGALLICRRARANPDRCPELAAILHGWDGHFTILIRKRVARHIEGCAVCERERRGLLNPVALLGAAPVFIPAPAWLRDKTLSQIQLTSARADIDAETVSYDTSALTATTQRVPLPEVGAAPDIDGPTERFGPDSGDAEEDGKRDRSRLKLLLLLLFGLPLVAVGLTIVILRLPDSAVAPIGDTEKAPAVTVGDPAGTTPTAATPSDAGRARAPQNVVPAVIPQAPQQNSPAPPAVAPSQPSPTVAKSQQAQGPTTRQARTFTPPPPQQRAPAQAPPEQELSDPEPAELQPPAQQAPAQEPEEPPVPLQDQARIQERHSPPVDDATTTVPYPR